MPFWILIALGITFITGSHVILRSINSLITMDRNVLFLAVILIRPPAGLCGGTAGEGPRDAETQHPAEERGVDAMRSSQLLPPPQNQPVTPNPEERCRHADPTTKPQRLSKRRSMIRVQPSQPQLQVDQLFLLRLSTVSAYITCRECGSVPLA